MRSISLTLLISFLGLSLLNIACTEDPFCLRPSGDVVEQELEISSLSGIHLNTPGKLYLSQGSEPSLTVKAYENVFKSLDYSIEDGVLILEINKCFQTFDMEIFLTVDQPITEIAINGSGDILSESRLEAAEELDLTISGTGSITVETQTSKLNSQISGKGNIFLTGEADYHYAKIIGTGNLQAFDFPVQDYLMKIAGAGSAEVAVNGGELQAEITGAGKIIYKGEVSDVSSRITGTGKVVKAD